MVRAAGIEPAQVLRPYGFSYHLDFRRRQPRSWSGLYLHLDLPALGAAHLVSTPSRFRAWLGIATCEVSPNLSSSTSKVSQGALNFCSSPLRLPVSPRPLETPT